MDSRLEDILQRAIERLRSGEPLEEILRSYPDEAHQLLPLIAPVRELLHAHVLQVPINQFVRTTARQRVLADVERERRSPTRRGSLLAGFWSQPAFRAASLAGAVALFGAASLGAAAATGSAPEPVRQLFGLNSGSTIRVEFDGIVQTVDAASGTLVVAADTDARTVVVTDDTVLSRVGGAIVFADLIPGMMVEVKGRLRADNAIVASRVYVEHDGEPLAQPTTDASTPLDDDDDDDDHSGPGGDEGDDDELDDDDDGLIDDGEHVGDDDGAALQTPGPDADDDTGEDSHDDGDEPEELDDDEPEDDDDVSGAEGHDDEEADESEGAGD